MPRSKHSIWVKFDCITTKNTGNWARCKTCKKEMQGIPSRMEKHLETCVVDIQRKEPTLSDTELQHYKASTSKENQVEHTDLIQQPLPKKQRTLSILADSKVISTSSEYALKIEKQIARYFYSTNTPLHHADHPEFKKMCSLMRSGYKGPSAYQIGNPIFDTVYKEVKEECREKIRGQTVCMSLDGWSNIHNEPIVCCNIVTSDGESIVVDSVDTGVNPHTATNLKDVALKAIKRAEEDFQVRVKSFVTDNAANVQKMRSDPRNFDGLILPPCKAELKQQTLRAIYISSLWCNAHLQCPTLLSPTDCGWNELDGRLQFRWFKGDQVPASVSEIVIDDLAKVDDTELDATNDNENNIEDHKAYDSSSSSEDWDCEDASAFVESVYDYIDEDSCL